MNRKKMKIAIIGGGFTGLAAALYLSRNNCEVTIFESGKKAGGLALGFKKKAWKWPIEHHYHHLFSSDRHIRKLARSVNQKIIFKRVKTSIFLKGSINQLDSPKSLLLFSLLPLLSRIRTGLVLTFLKILSTWRPLETITAEYFLKKTMGRNSWEKLWYPLLKKKFGKYYKVIPASWFWARIKSRSSSLGYPEGGFQSLAENIALKIKKNGGKIFYNSAILNVKRNDENFVLQDSNSKKHYFDRVICTLSMNIFKSMVDDLPKSYKEKFNNFKGIGASNMILSLTRQFINDQTYWLNVNDNNIPILAVVEHTNFVSKKYYNNSHLIYVGNYLDVTSKYASYSEKDLLELYIKSLKKINPEFSRNWIKEYWFSRVKFAQPIIHRNYSKNIFNLDTPIYGIYIANMQQVYPWDRGTNYAVELGENVAKLLLNQIK